MKTKATILTTLIAIAVIVGCKKEPDNPASPIPPDVTTSSPFRTLFANNIANATQTFNLNATTGGQVMGNKGTQLDFEPGAFVYENGTPVTGQVQVSLVEVLTISDMLWLNVQTVGNDNGNLRMLRSGGAINVYANQGSVPVQITNGGLIAKIPTNVGDPNMELFRGNPNEDGNMIWDRIDSAIISVDSAYYDTTDYTYTYPYYFNYGINGDSLNWTNVDIFWNYPNTTTLTSTLPAGQSTDSTLVWVAFPSENAVLNMNFIGSETYQAPWQVPLGMQAVIVGLKQDAVGYSSSFTTVNVTSNMNVPMIFSPTTIQQFEDDVNAL
ncbi:MAG: hypothetical protein WAR83_06140 [Flavobacteriales bacterium]|jgi:hypothetical protein